MQKENESIRASRNIDVRNSYANLHIQKSKGLHSLKPSKAGAKGNAEPLIRASTAAPPKVRPRSPAKKARGSFSNRSLSDVTPLTNAIDDEAKRLQQELQAYDQKLQVIKSHLNNIPPPPIPAPVPSSMTSKAATTLQQPSFNAPAAAPAFNKKHSEPQASSGSSHLPIARDLNPVEQGSVVKSVITATGTGCKEVITVSTRPGQNQTSSSHWTTRPHKSAFAESSCTLQLVARHHADVTVRITFADPASVPAVVRFEHATKPTAAFEPLGEVRLHARSMRQLKHMFRLGTAGPVQRCIRISCIGHISKDNSGMHKVNFLSVTGNPIHAAGPDESEVFDIRSSVAGKPRGQDMLETAESLPRDVHESVDITVMAPSLLAEAGGDGMKGKGAGTRKKSAAPPAPPMPKKAAPPPPPPLPFTAGGKTAAKKAAAENIDVNDNGVEGGNRAPTRPTVRLFWDKLQLQPGQVEDTVWGELQGMESQLDYSNLEEEFAVAQPPSTAPKTVASKLQSTKNTAKANGRPGSTTVLSVQRVNNVGVLLARLKLTAEQAERAILHLLCEDDHDEEAMEDAGGSKKKSQEQPPRKLDEDAIASLMLCLPTPQEGKALAQFEGNVETLSQAERFMIAMLPVPRAKERLEVECFKAQFESRVDDIARKAALLNEACKEVRGSALLKTVFKTALLIGNFLNSGNRNGSATGFSVDALLKLKDVKSTRARSRSLLHFLAREVARLHPDEYSLRTALPSCKAAARLDLSAVRGELEELATGLLDAERTITASNNTKYAATMESFICGGADALAAAQGRLVDADAAFLNLRSFVNGRRDTMEEPGALFGVLDKFAGELDMAHAENAAADKQAAKLNNTTTTKRNTNEEEGPAFNRPATAPSSVGKKPNGAGDDTPPLRRRDRMLATIRLYSRMSADQRKALLTEKGAAERLKKMNITHRHSVVAPPNAQHNRQQGVPRPASSDDDAMEPAAASEQQYKSDAAKRIAARASAPAAALAAVLQKSRARRLSNSSLHPADSLASTQHLSAVGEEPEEQANTEEQHAESKSASSFATEAIQEQQDSPSVATSKHIPASSMCNIADLTPAKDFAGSPEGLQQEGSGESSGVMLAAATPSVSNNTAGTATNEPRRRKHVVVSGGKRNTASTKAGLSSPVAKLVASSTRLIQSMETSVPLQPAAAVDNTVSNADMPLPRASRSRVPAQRLQKQQQKAAVELTPLQCSSPEDDLPAVSEEEDQRASAMQQSRRSVQNMRASGGATTGAMMKGAMAGAAAIAGAAATTAAPAAGLVRPRSRPSHRSSVQLPNNTMSQTLRRSADTLSPTSTPLASFKSAGGAANGRRSSRWEQAALAAVDEVPTALETYEEPQSNKRPRSAPDVDTVDFQAGMGMEGNRQPQFASPIQHGRIAPVGGVAPMASVGAGPTRWDELPVDPYFQSQDYRDYNHLIQQQQQQHDGVEQQNGGGGGYWVPDPECPLTGDSAAAICSDDSEYEGGESDGEQGKVPRQEEQQQQQQLSAVAMPMAGVGATTAAGTGGIVGGLDLQKAASLLAAADKATRQSWAHPPRPPRPSNPHHSNNQNQLHVAKSMPAAFHSNQQHTENNNGPVLNVSASVAVPGGSMALTTSSNDDSSAARLYALRQQAAAVLASALASDMQRSLPSLPGVSMNELPALPLPSGQPKPPGAPISPHNLDAIMAAVIANAGNTPTGPLARGVREGDEELFDDSPANALREEVASREPHRALLEPVVPAPLGMGVRASETVAQGISPLSLRQNLAQHLRPLQPSAEELSMHSRMRSRSHQHSGTHGSSSGVVNASVQGPIQPAAAAVAASQLQHRNQQQPGIMQQSMQHSQGTTGGSHGFVRSNQYSQGQLYQSQQQQGQQHANNVGASMAQSGGHGMRAMPPQQQQQQYHQHRASHESQNTVNTHSTTGSRGGFRAAANTTLAPLGNSAMARQQQQQDMVLQQALQQHQQQLQRREMESISMSQPQVNMSQQSMGVVGQSVQSQHQWRQQGASGERNGQYYQQQRY